MRVLEAHYLTMSPDRERHLHHGMSEIKIDNMISAEKTNKFGPKSWIRKAVLGKTCTTNVQVLQTNYALMRRYHQIVTAGVENPAQRVRRAANERAFEQAGVALDTQWSQVYLNQRNLAAIQKHKHQSTLKGEEWISRYDHWDRLRCHPPQCHFDITTFATRAKVLEASQQPLIQLPSNMREALWRNELWSEDALATLLWGLWKHPRYPQAR